MQLFPYQVEGARFLASVKRGLLADEMGLGKSAQAITAAREVGARTVLVVCPASLRQNWLREFNRFWPDHNATLIVHSYDMAAKKPLLDKVDVLILDEAHYLKSAKAKRTKAIFGDKCDGVGGLIERATHVFCLTGTPTPNNPSELWPMLRAVMPASLMRPTKLTQPKPYAYWHFVERFCVTRDTGFGIAIVKGKNLPELKARIAPFVLRRKKDEVLKDLPPIRFDELALEGKFDIRGDYDLEEEIVRIREALADGGVKALAAIAPHVASLRRATGLAKVPAAIDWIKDFVEGGQKLVVFAHHRDVVKTIHETLLGGGIPAVKIDGSCDAFARQHAVDRFQSGDARLFVGQIQAAGTGLTLTAASDVLFVESSWVPSENQQAAMRVHRIGQQNACLIRFAMLAGSIDEDIQRACLRKTTDITKLFA